MKLIGITVLALVIFVGGMIIMKFPPFVATSDIKEADTIERLNGDTQSGSSPSGQSMEVTAESIAINTVEIKDYSFNPPNLTVKAGTIVTFVNKDSVGHSATADDESFDTGIMIQNESGTVTFNNPGTYTYHCTPHPNMKGTVVVE